MAFQKLSSLSVNTLILLNTSIPVVFAGGFQMHEQNGSVGDVHAGYAVDNHDASVSFYNSAALTDILEPQTTNSAVTVASKLSFKGSTSLEITEAASSGAYPPVVGTGQTSTSGVNVIPSLHYAAPISNNYAFGLSIVAPFASELSWSEKAFTRYNATTNGIKAINFSPSFAYRVSDELSLGLGGDIQYVAMQIDKIVGANFDIFFNGQPYASSDSVIRNNLTHTGLGWHTGALWKPTNHTKLGFTYRSGLNHHATGSSSLKGKLAGGFVDTPHKENKSKNLAAIIKIPQTFALSGAINPIEDWTFVSTVMYTNWAVVKSFDLKNVPGTMADEPVFIDVIRNTLGLKDTYTFLNGVHWQYNDQIKLKAGFGYDRTPTSNRYRDLKMPDGDRYLFGLGANYRYSHNLNLEFGWMYVMVPNTKIDHVSNIPAVEYAPGMYNYGETTGVKGKAHGNAHVVGMQFTLNTADMYGYASRKLGRIV